MGIIKDIIEFPFGVFKSILPDTRDPKSRKYYYSSLKIEDTPVDTDRSLYLSYPNFDQGRMGSCVRCSIAGGMEMVYRQNGQEKDFAEQQYLWDEDTDSHRGEGMKPEHGLRETLRIGQSESVLWETYKDQFKFMAQPKDEIEARANASKHKIVSFHRMTKVDQIYQANTLPYGFVCGSFWLDDQWNNKRVEIIKYKKKAPKYALHEMIFWLSMESDGMLGLVTSWGKFGINGTGKVLVEPEWVESRMQDLHFVKVFES